MNENSTVGSAVTGDDLLSALAVIDQDNRWTALAVCGVKILRDAADLCGVDSVNMSKSRAIASILGNF